MFDLVTSLDDIQKLEDVLLEMPQAELRTEHFFAEGTYTRVLYLPEGATLTGKVHRHSCINILAEGKMLVITNEDEYEIEAPFVFVSGSGIKKAGHALEDSVWINVHPWNGSDDLEKIEAKVILPQLLEEL